MKTRKMLSILCLLNLLKIVLYICDKNIQTEKSERIASSDSLLKNVLKHSPKVSEEEIEEGEIKIMDKAHEEEYKAAEKLHMCIKDYTTICPKHWKKIEINKRVLCQAEPNYNGFCEVIQSFDTFTEEEKIKFEISCNVQWPCKHEVIESCKNGRDYSEPCPEGFILQSDNSCAADITKYTGFCVSNNIKFSHMTPEEKEKWSIACEAFWPCYEECAENENLSYCPKYWKQENNSSECVPEETYNGPCKNKKSFTYFTDAMKKEFEKKCKTKFECIKTPCEVDYDKNCPENWTEEEGTCIAPSSFDLCDRKKLSIENTNTINDKKQFEKECSVKWPCKPKFCDMQWHLSCPDGWIHKDKIENLENANFDKNRYSENDDVFFCEPPSFYKGKCDHIILSKNSDENTKRELASSCDAPWSCIDKRESIKKSKGKIFLSDEAESGPITSTGKIFRSSKYDITDKQSSNIHEIMQ